MNSTKKVIAKFGERSYCLYYGHGLLKHIDRYLKNIFTGQQVAIVSHAHLQKKFGADLEKGLRAMNKKVHWILLPPGEINKTLTNVEKVYKELARAKIDKSSLLIALGGGMIQDLSTYVAATYLRGIPFAQIPSTLLSQADIGIGGCAIDHSAGKSLIGTFYQPRVVISDQALLKTLPAKEISNGLAEVINKVVCLGGTALKELRQDIPKMRNGDLAVLGKYILQSNQVKIKIIEQDETGTHGTRSVLDFGHTLTHAIEKATNYKMSHGFALGIGMHAAFKMSERKNKFSSSATAALLELIELAGLPTRLPKNLALNNLLALMYRDQKVKNGHIRFVLLAKPGRPTLSAELTDAEVGAAINSI